MSYDTGNPLGSTDPRDFSDNSENFDRAVNNTESATWTDRFGKSRTTLAGQVGYIGTGSSGAIESYSAGLVLSTYSTIILYNNEFYRPSASATLPYTTTATTPDVDDNLVAVGDAVLRQDLANSAATFGSELVARSVLQKKSIAEVEALTGTVNNIVYLDSGGRSGHFYWDASDLSTEVAADTQQGIYIAPSSDATGASGAWVRQYKGPVFVEWFGGTYDNTDSTAAVDAAVAMAGVNGEIKLSAGQLAYSGTFTILQGQKLTGPGNNCLEFNITVDNPGDYAISLAGVSSTVARDFRVLTTYNGIDFSPTSGSNCVLNYWENVEFIGDNIGIGRGADATTNDNIGIRFGPMNGSIAAFFNTVRRPYIRGFNTNILFDANTGSPTTGGNANQVMDAQNQSYWFAYRYRSIENKVHGGFCNASSGTGSSSPNYTIMHKLENGASRNDIDAPIGEPGANAKGFEIDSGCNNNYIPIKAYNVGLGNSDNGNNNGISSNYADTVTRFYSGLPENTYQKIKLCSLTINASGATCQVNYEGRNTAIARTSNGTYEFYIYRDSVGTVSVETKSVSDNRSGNGVPIMVGTEVDGSDVYLVFFVINNSTATNAFLRVAALLLGDTTNDLSPSFSATTAPSSEFGASNSNEFIGRFVLSELPTSSSGLVSGSVWNDAGTLKIVT